MSRLLFLSTIQAFHKNREVPGPGKQRTANRKNALNGPYEKPDKASELLRDVKMPSASAGLKRFGS